MSPDASENPTGNTPQPLQAPGPPTARRGLWIALAVLGAVLSLALIVTLSWQAGGGAPVTAPATSMDANPDESAPPAPSGPTTPAQNPTPTPTQPGQGAAPGTPRPSSCEQLYSAAMVEALGGLALNPEWSTDPDADVSHGTDDPELRALIDSLDHLTCVWGNPYGGSETGIVTNLSWVTPEQSVAVEAGLAAAGLECTDQSGGVRCDIQTTTSEGAFGESHFLRDGIWLATKYTNAGPLGYTQDIINSLWVAV